MTTRGISYSGEIMSRPVTFSSLAADFGIPVREVMELAGRAGVPSEPRNRYLSDGERDRLYDSWLKSQIPPVQHSMKPQKRPERENMTMIDTSSLLEDGAYTFLKKAAPIFLKEGRKLIVPAVVMNELNAKAMQDSNPELSRRARNIMNTILNYRDMGVIAIYGDDNDGTFADNVFHKAAAMFGLRYNLTVITQDYRLGQDLLAMGRMQSVHNRRIRVRKIARSGELVPVKWKE